MGTDLDSDRVKEKRADKWGEKKKKLLYEDLGGLSCILLLVDKGRKGDTFPQVSVLCVNICACERSSVRARKHIYLCIKLGILCIMDFAHHTF